MRFLRHDDCELWAEPPAVIQDDKLRSLVDALPGLERHMVERVHFGLDTLTKASREIGVSRSTGSRLLAEGLGRLKDWILTDHTPVQPPDFDITRYPPGDPCVAFLMHDGHDIRCQQLAIKGTQICASHTFWFRTGIEPVHEYHLQVLAGGRAILEFLTEPECEALVNGRYRGDGRRIDIYTSQDPLGFMPGVGS